MSTVGIVGFGRFGQFLAGILRDDFDVKIVERDVKLQELAKECGLEVVSLRALSSVDVIVLAVPISTLAKVLEDLAPIAGRNQVVMDVCSVKTYPSRMMRHYLPKSQLIATHPLFGPDSAREGLAGLKMVICPLVAGEDLRTFWRTFWENKGVQVIESTPERHDHDMAYSLGLTQTLARLVGRMNLPELELTTRSFDAVKRVTDFSLNDTDQLYHDMLYYNPFLSELQQRFEAAAKQTTEHLRAIKAEQTASTTVSKNRRKLNV